MKIGNLVTFKKSPTLNTPGVPRSSSVTTIGTIVDQPTREGLMFKGSLWVDVMWPSNEVTRCFKQDLAVVENIDNFEANLF